MFTRFADVLLGDRSPWADAHACLHDAVGQGYLRSILTGFEIQHPEFIVTQPDMYKHYSEGIGQR